MSSRTIQDLFDPDRVMDPRRLGALQPSRLSASRSFIDTMISEHWRIECDALDVDVRGNGRARYTIRTPKGDLTFLAFLREPAGGNRTFRIIGTSWDMIGSLLDGIATEEQVAATAREIDKLYEGRAPAGTLAWFRSNQSLRIFQHVRESIAAGRQPDLAEIKRVGYLMRNTGLDGNGTFGTTSFRAIPADHPLATSYFAQMLAAYLMRELSVDLVEELARIDSPATAVRLAPEARRFIGVGNGSALGLVMFVYNRPLLIDAYLAVYLDALDHVLSTPIEAGDERFAVLERLLDRAITYRTLEDTQYRVFAGAKEHAADLRRVRTVLRAARRGELVRADGETLLGAVHRRIRALVCPEAEGSFNSILFEIIPDYCDRLIEERLVFDETLRLDPATPVQEVRDDLEEGFAWALSLPLNDPQHRDRVWYQSRAAEEPRSGPRDEVPGAHDVVPNYPTAIRELHEALRSHAAEEPIGVLLAARPELEYITRLVLSLAEHPYAVPHVDPHDDDFVPVWLVRLMNSVIHGLDRTEDYLNRVIRGLIFEGAPFRDELAEADPTGWWWSYRTTASSAPEPATGSDSAEPSAERAERSVRIAPKETLLVAPDFPTEERLVLKHREARLVSGRAMQALGVPEGSWHGARDFFITAMIADTGAVAAFGRLLAEDLDDRGACLTTWSRPAVSSRADGIAVVDGRGQSLLVIGHTLVNLIGALAAGGDVVVELTGIRTDSALPGLLLALAQYGVEARAGERSERGARISARPADDPAACSKRYDDGFDRLIRDGLDLPAQTWWNVYFPSHAGMHPDSDISRQHTGTSIADVRKPGQKLTRQFAAEELVGLDDPDDRDNRSASFASSRR